MCDGCQACPGTFCASSDYSQFSYSSWEMIMVSHTLLSTSLFPIISFTDSFPAANQMSQQMAQMNPAANANPFGPGQDPDKLFLAEAENLEVLEHYSILEGIEERLLKSQSS